ncbi:MAG: flagellar basal body rod C-terminal domain-containing protein [Planctomycetota bacterium]
MFSGEGAGGLRVRDDIANDPNLLAIGDSGNSADTANLVRILALQQARSPASNLTISELSLNISSSIGFEVQNTTNESVQLTNVRAQLEQERDSVSGVDLNEELVFLQNFQRSYEAAARIVQAMDNIFEELVNILR